MSYRTPYAKVEGLGAAHSGTEHFWRQRISAAALIPLAIWFAVNAFMLIGGTYEAAHAFLATPVNAVLMALFVIAIVIHMTLGLQVVIEDYVHSEGRKIFGLLLMRGFAWIVGAAMIFAILKIAL